MAFENGYLGGLDSEDTEYPQSFKRCLLLHKKCYDKVIPEMFAACVMRDTERIIEAEYTSGPEDGGDTGAVIEWMTHMMGIMETAFLGVFFSAISEPSPGTLHFRVRVKSGDFMSLSRDPNYKNVGGEPDHLLLWPLGSDELKAKG